MPHYNKQRILITGCCGTVGAELIKILTAVEPGPVRLLGVDINERALAQQRKQLAALPGVTISYGDVRDVQAMHDLMSDIDLVFHTAALKHIPYCEQSPMDAVHSNIAGVQNVIAAALSQQVARVLFTSSDKGVNPASVMGATKLVGERLITGSQGRDGSQTIFSSTRFGNVLGSSGSVVPVFHQQIAAGGPVTLTDPGMTRFAMTIRQAAELLLTSAEMATGGEVFITKMPVIRVKDLAEVMIAELAPIYGHDPKTIQLLISGVRPGEKLNEELMSQEEVSRARELRQYFVVSPITASDNKTSAASRIKGTPVSRAYTVDAATVLTQPQLRDFLREGGLLNPIALSDQP